MKILVFDDSKEHRDSAPLSLVGHDVKVVGTYDAAQEALIPHTDHDKELEILAKLLEDAGFAPDYRPGRDVSDEERDRYTALRRQADEQATTHHDFDVVMTDLFVPASSQAQGTEGLRYVGKEMPLGTGIALLAISVGVKNVAVVTDMNHHHHPASATFDCIGALHSEYLNLLCINYLEYLAMDEKTGEVISYDYLETEEGKRKYPFPEGRKYGDRLGIRYGKNWGQVLNRLLGIKDSGN